MASGGVGPGQASVGPAAGVASTGASTLLWAKTQQLPEEAFRQLHSIYGDHFPIEARHHLAGKSSSFATPAKGGFFSESAIRFSNLPISQKNSPKKLS